VAGQPSGRPTIDLNGFCPGIRQGLIPAFRIAAQDGGQRGWRASALNSQYAKYARESAVRL